MTTWDGKSGLKPHVLRSGEIIAAQFLVPRVLGVGLRTDVANSDHPRGLALDFMCPIETQNRIRIYLVTPSNWKLHNVKYVINQNKIWNRPEQGGYVGEKYTGPNPHTDHVHVSYLDTGALPDGTGTDPFDTAPELTGAVDSAAETLGMVKQIYEALKKIGEVFAFLSDQKNWKRIAWFMIGLVASIIGLLKLDVPGASKTVSKVAKVVK